MIERVYGHLDDRHRQEQMGKLRLLPDQPDDRQAQRNARA